MLILDIVYDELLPFLPLVIKDGTHRHLRSGRARFSCQSEASEAGARASAANQKPPFPCQRAHSGHLKCTSVSCREARDSHSSTNRLPHIGMDRSGFSQCAKKIDRPQDFTLEKFRWCMSSGLFR